MKRLPSFFGLRALEAAARHRSYSAAARELNVTQGAISQQIRKLEAEVGARLFERRGNDMVPTLAAERLAAEVGASVDRLQTAVSELAATADEEPLVLSLATPFAARWLGPKLPRLLADPAGSNLDIRVEERIANFAGDGVDVGVRAGRGGWPNLHAERLTVERLCVVCTPEFQATLRIRDAKDLLAAPLVDSHERLWPLLFERYGLPGPPPGQLSIASTLLALDAVYRGLGAALIRYSMVHEDLRAGRLVRPLPDFLPLPVNFIRPGQLVKPWREGDPLPPEIGYFVVWRPDNRKLRRIRVLCDWLVAEARRTEDIGAYLGEPGAGGREVNSPADNMAVAGQD